jgi:hypothetical protein
MFKYQIYSTKKLKQEIAKEWTQSMLVDWTHAHCPLLTQYMHIPN